MSIHVGERPCVSQETKHAVDHVRMVHGLLLLPFHLLQQLLLPPRLLLHLPLPLLLLLGQLDQPLLVFPLGLCLGPPSRHLVPQLLLLGEALALGFQATLQLWGDVREESEGPGFTEAGGVQWLAESLKGNKNVIDII